MNKMHKNLKEKKKVDTSNMKNALAGIAAVLDAAAFSTNDRKKLMALTHTIYENSIMEAHASKCHNPYYYCDYAITNTISTTILICYCE